jgi:hypothetical protein
MRSLAAVIFAFDCASSERSIGGEHGLESVNVESLAASCDTILAPIDSNHASWHVYTLANHVMDSSVDSILLG